MESSEVQSIDPAHRIPLQHRDLVSIATLIDPPCSFTSHVRVDSRFLDFRWLRAIRKGAPMPPCKFNLLNMREDLLAQGTLTSEGEDAILLDSPRSIVTVLRNGVKVERLQHKPLTQVNLEGSLEGLTPELCQRRYNHTEQNRRTLLENLRQQYRYLRATTPLEEVFRWFQQFYSIPAHQTPPKIEGEPETRKGGPSGSRSSSRAASPSPTHSIRTAENYAKEREEAMEQKRVEIDKLCDAGISVKARFVERQRLQQILLTQKNKHLEDRYHSRLAALKERAVARAIENQKKIEEKKNWVKTHEKEIVEHLRQLQEQRLEKEQLKLAVVERKQQELARKAKETGQKIQVKLQQCKQTQQQIEQQKKLQVLKNEQYAAQKSEERRKLLEEKMKQAHMEAEKKSQHRDLALQQSQELEEKKRMEALVAQARVNQRIKLFLATKHDNMKEREKLGEVREQKRKAVIDSAIHKNEHLQTTLLQRQQQQEATYFQQTHGRLLHCLTHKEEMRLMQKDKREFLDREQNKRAFYDLAMIDNLQRKMNRIEETTRQRQDTVQKTKYYSATATDSKSKRIRDIDDYFLQQQKQIFFASHNNLPMPDPDTPDPKSPTLSYTTGTPSKKPPAMLTPLPQSAADGGGGNGSGGGGALLQQVLGPQKYPAMLSQNVYYQNPSAFARVGYPNNNNGQPLPQQQQFTTQGAAYFL